MLIRNLQPHTKLSFNSLPQLAKDKMSEEQISYSDEFSFYRYNDSDNDIEAYYGGEYLATWNGKGWE